jgi:ABC-type sugar transport system permease subunit/ABC-type glycerol-3-phosphate transport system substrate-binding protein
MSRLRMFILVVGAVVLMVWLYPRTSDPRGDDVTEVTIWFNGVVEGRHIDVVDAFERRFPEFRGILGSSAARTGLDGEGNPQRLMCGIAGGVPPEVVEYDRFAIAQWAARKAFCDLNPLIEKDAAELAAARAELARLESGGGDAAAIAALTARIARLEKYAIRRDDYYRPTWDECMYEGGLYGIPNYMDDRALYFNTDLLLQAGFADEEGNPQPPDTWEQIIRKRVDATDARIDGERVTIPSADVIEAGVRPGDTLVQIVEDKAVFRCRVAEVLDANTLRVESAYSRRGLKLHDGNACHVKVFDQDGYLLRLSRWSDEGELRVVGFEPQHGNGWLYHYGWLNGGQFLSDDGRTCTLDEPRIVEALQFTTDIYDALGGVSEVNAFKKSFQTAAQDPFFLNQIAMFIHGDWFLRDLARYKRDMRFGTYPPPQPEARRAEGIPPVTFLAGFAYCIPSTCPEEKREAAWWMVKFLSSVDGGMVLNEHDAQRERGQGRLYMPRLMANRVLNEAQFAKYVDIPEMPARVRAGLQTFVKLLDHARFRPVSPEGQKLWNAQADAQDQAWNHGKTPKQALADNGEKVQRALERFFTPPAGPTVNWWWALLAYAIILLVVARVVFVRFRARHQLSGFQGRQWWIGLLFASPWMAGFIVLAGGPMLFSIVMSFTNYDVISPATFVGLDNYREMFGVDWGNVGGVADALGNTLFMAIALPLSMVAGLGLAMLLNCEVRGMSIYRTTFFLPAIMPVVAASVLWIWVFNAHNGLMNWLLQMSGIESLLDWSGIKTPISWLTNKHTSKPALIIMLLWGSGASMIIWLAGLKEIPTFLYEAASLDGAGPIRRFFTVTLPMLSPYILFNLIMGLIQTFQIFTQAYIMTPNGSPERSTYFYVYKLFDECFSYFRLGYGAAMAWVLFAIVIVLTLINMWGSKRWVHYAGD